MVGVALKLRVRSFLGSFELGSLRPSQTVDARLRPKGDEDSGPHEQNLGPRYLVDEVDAVGDPIQVWRGCVQTSMHFSARPCSCLFEGES